MTDGGLSEPRLRSYGGSAASTAARSHRCAAAPSTSSLCSLCTRPDATFWRSCPTCGQRGRLHKGRCARCNVEQRLHELLADDAGNIPADREPLYHVLAATERPATLATWLAKSTAPQILRDLAESTLTHEVLDDLPTGKTVEHLRSILVATGILPLPALGKEGETRQARRSRRQVGRSRPGLRHRDTVGASTLAAPRQHHQTRGPACRTARAALRPMARHDRPPHRRPRPHQRRAGPHPTRRRTHRAAWGAPNPLPRSPSTSSPADAAKPPSATQAPRPGCSPAGNPVAHSAPSAPANDSANSACIPDKHAPPHCSSSPPTCPPQCSPRCLASTSALPSPGSEPAAATGWPMPPTSAGEHLNQQSAH